jgi:hypothetical protein
VKPTPRLKRILQAEITTLRRAQPKTVRVLPSKSHPPLIPAAGGTCFVAGAGRCSEVPCQEFASTPAVLQQSSTGIIRGAPVVRGASGRAVSPSCPHGVHKLVLVSGP